jgi:hypothetical protein
MTFQFYSFKLLRKEASAGFIFLFETKTAKKHLMLHENLTSQSWSSFFRLSKLSWACVESAQKTLSIKALLTVSAVFLTTAKNVWPIRVKETAR